MGLTALLNYNGEGYFSGIEIHLKLSEDDHNQKRLMLSNSASSSSEMTFSLSSGFYGFSPNQRKKSFTLGKSLQGPGDPFLAQNLPPNAWVVYLSE